MWNQKHLELITNRKLEFEIIQNHIKKKAIAGEPLQILEAGCGRKWPLNLDNIKYFLTGIDSDKAALELRKNIKHDLNKSIHGDLKTIKLKENQYDIIYCSFVLEHIKGAEEVLINFIDWIKPLGIIIIRIPDPNSAKGFITRTTPFWSHVFYYRYILGYQNAGNPGHPPYPVYYDSVVSQKGMREFCNRNNLIILAEYGDGYAQPGRGIYRLLIHFANQLISVLSFGILSSKHTGLLYIIQKN